MRDAFISESPKNGNGLGPVEQAEARPTTVRWWIMILVAVVNMLPSLGRISLGVTAKSLQEEFQFSTTTMGWVLSAFWLSYGLFQLPGGWAGDRYGPRRVLTLAILWYSLFMATMAVIPTIPASRWFGMAWSFAAIQFLIGAGEAFTAPNSAKIVGSWMNKKKIGFGISFTTLGIGAGGCVTPIFIVWTMQRWGWRTSFVLCGLIGVLVAVVWGWYVANRPEEHRGVNAAELAQIRLGRATRHEATAALSGPTPWRRIFSSGSVWALLASYACRAYPMYFFNTWFFIYLVKVRGLTVVRGGIMSSTPFLAVLLLSPVGGWFSDLASNRLGKGKGRQLAVWICMGCSAGLVWVGCHTANNWAAIVLVATGAGFNMAGNVTWWAACVDLAPRHSGSLSGLMNMFGGAGGWLAPILTGYIATAFGWAKALDLIALLSVLSGLLWVFIDVETSLEREPSASLA